jgi:hypothetical protein
MIGQTLLQDIESLEAITRDDDARALFLRMAALSHSGRLESFVDELMDDRDIDAETKGTLAEIARDPDFLLAVEDYVRSTQLFH